MKKNNQHTWVCSLAIAIALSISHSAPTQAQSTGRSFGVGKPFALEELPTGKLKDKLTRLPRQSRNKAKQWLDNIRFHERDVPFMRVDGNGGIYFADTDLSHSGSTSSPVPKSGAVAAITPAEALKLHSRPGAAHVFYLDFTGHVITQTAWNNTYSTLTAIPYDLDGNPGHFSDLEAGSIAEIWRRVAEDYAPFDIDITTEEPPRFGPTVARLLVTSDIDANGLPLPGQGAGGVGYVGVWGRSDYASTYSPAMVYYNRLGNGRPDYVSEAAAHEMGHNLGLSHDATSNTDYYGGHGTGYTSWGPIMGTGYGRDVTQWSKGEYPDANQFQDDTAIISSKISYRPDDHGNTRATATALVVDATGIVLSTTPAHDPYDQTKVNKGVISHSADVDVFSFVSTGGTITLQATPFREAQHSRGGDLDIVLALYDNSGNLITSSNPADDTDAGVSLTLAAGTYYVSIQGTGSANYSSYGSLGQYFIEGVLPVTSGDDSSQNEVLDTTAPNPDPMGWAIAPQALTRNSISMTAVTAVDENSPVEYLFECVSGGTGCSQSGWQVSGQYVATGLSANTTYSFRVRARDGAGNETVNSVTASAKTLANKAPLAVGDSGSVDNTGSLSLNVLANDRDPEGDALVLSGVGAAAHGSTRIEGGKVVYTPERTYTGTDQFTYTVADAFGAEATASVSITVKAVAAINRAPTALADRVWVTRGQTVTIPVLANDTDPDGDALSISAISRAYSGAAVHNGREIIYTAGSQRGFDILYYLISDGHGNRAFTWVLVYIR